MRNSFTEIANKISKDLNYYMHNEAYHPIPSKVKEKVNEIDPFISYASHLKYA